MSTSIPAEQLRPPSLRRRAAARAVDLTTVFTLIWALATIRVLFHIPLWSDDIAPSPWGRSFLFVVTFTLAYLVYEVVYVSQTGATPGKDLMRLQVLDSSSGALPSLDQAVRRALPLTAIWLVPAVWLGAPLTAALGATGLPDTSHFRTIHDRFSATRVVHVPDLDPEPGTTHEEAEAERRRQFVPRFVDPIHIVPSQLLRHPHLRRALGDGDEGSDERRR